MRRRYIDRHPYSFNKPELQNCISYTDLMKFIKILKFISYGDTVFIGSSTSFCPSRPLSADLYTRKERSPKGAGLVYILNAVFHPKDSEDCNKLLNSFLLRATKLDFK